MLNSSSLYASVDRNSLGELMLSFELSAIDLILVIAVIVLLILYLRRPSVNVHSEGKLPVEAKVSPKMVGAPTASLEKGGREPVSTPPQRDSARCPYGFGYLRKVDKKAPIPDACLSCSRISECLYQDM